MKVVHINTYCDGSTGNIATSIMDEIIKSGNTAVGFYGRCKRKKDNWKYIGESKLSNLISNVLTYFTGRVGDFHYGSTKKLINELQKMHPDIIHIHNLHGNYLSFKMFFDYLRSFDGKIIFTLHDDFLYTGRCASATCDNWKNCCSVCKNLKAYPHVCFDKAHTLFSAKYKYLESVADKSFFVAPTKYMIENFLLIHPRLVNRSFVINNGLDEKWFSNHNVHNESSFSKKDIVIAVANPWSDHKGIESLNRLSKDLDMDKFTIIAVGPVQKGFSFSNEIVSVGLVGCGDLIELYKKADVSLVLSKKESFSLVTIESLSQGVPVIAFDNYACNEILNDDIGIVIKQGEYEELLSLIKSRAYEKLKKDVCVKCSNKYKASRMIDEYLSIYLK